MNDICYDIPEAKSKDDFTINYTSISEFNDTIDDKYVQIKISRYELIKKFNTLKKNFLDITNINEIPIYDSFSPKMFKDFIETIKTKKITLNEANYKEYYNMSIKYGYNDILIIIKDFISKRQDITNVFNSLVNQSHKNEIDEINEKEKIISRHLDFCLINCDLSKLPIPSLIRIFNSSERVLDENSHHLLYNFIKEKVLTKEITKDDEEIKLLIMPLDLKLMTTEEILFLVSNKLFLNSPFMPRHSNEIMKLFIERNKILEEKCIKMETKMLNLEQKLSDHNKIIEEIYHNMSLLSKKNDVEQIKMQEDEMKKRINDQENEIKKLQINSKKQGEKTDQKQIESNQQISREIDEIKKELTKKLNYDGFIINVQFEKENCGIFSYLSDGNPADLINNKTIKITGEPFNNDACYQPKNVVNYKESDQCFHSTDKPNSYLCFEFTMHRVKLTHYTIQSHGRSKGKQLKNWVIEGSIGDDRWKLIDEQNNVKCLEKNSTTNTFTIGDHINKNVYYRFIRIRQTGPNTSGSDYLIFSSIEFYGSLITI